MSARALSAWCCVVAALAVGALACDDDADPDEASDQRVLEIATDTGEPVCLLVTDDLPPEVERLPIIDCEIAHTHEIYATVDYEEQSVFPGVEVLGEFAQVACLEAFEPFVGTSAFDSSLSYTWLVPTLGSWNDRDDREVLCVLASRDGSELRGSMQDSAA